MGWNDFSRVAAGERHLNDDGSCRQCELARLHEGEELTLEREPGNAHDPRAIAIYTRRRVKVGYLRARDASVIAPKLDRGYELRGIVDRVRGRELRGSLLGLVVRLNMEGDEPELA